MTSVATGTVVLRPHRNARRRRAAVALGAAALALTGCDSEGSGRAGRDPSTAPARATADPPTSTSDTVAAGTAGPAGDYTKQGTALALGQKAVVPFESNGHRGAIGVTVTGIDRGSQADLAPLQLGREASGMTPYYVRVTVSDERGADFSGSSLGSMSGRLADGSQAQGVSVIGTFEPCDNRGADARFTRPAATYRTCVLALAAGSTGVTGAAYDDGSYSTQAPDTDYGTAPITWKR